MMMNKDGLTRRRPPSIDPPQIKRRFGYKAALSARVSCKRSKDGLRTPLPFPLSLPPLQVRHRPRRLLLPLHRRISGRIIIIVPSNAFWSTTASPQRET